MLKIKKKIDEFSNEIDQFRAEFLAECPFQSGLSFDEAYAKIDVYYGKTLAMTQRAKEYNNLELLFDMEMSAYRPLKTWSCCSTWKCRPTGLLRFPRGFSSA
jgi:dynein heavy chain